MNPSFKALQLKARHQIYTLLSGNNLSKMHGEGYDFSELREYQIGDDVRKINWTISAKLGRPYIKELHANKELSVVVAAMMDGSLYFGEDNAKQMTLAQTAMMLGYAAHQNSDLFTGFCLHTDTYTLSPPTKHLYHLENFSKMLYELNILHTSLNYEKAIQTLFAGIHKRSLLFIIGDFLEPVDLSLLAQKHEVVAVIIRHRDEEHPKKLGEVILDNPRATNSLDTYVDTRALTRYLAKLQAHDEALKAQFLKYGIRYLKIYTDEEPVEKLLRFFR